MPKRVASLLPAATEIICMLDAEHTTLVATSHECNHPNNLRKPVLTQPALEVHQQQHKDARTIDDAVTRQSQDGKPLYKIDASLMRSLEPDVIITQDLCSVCAIDAQTVERVCASMRPQPTVVSLDPMSLDDVLDCVLTVGDAIGLPAEARAARDALARRVAAVDRRVSARPSTAPATRVGFVEWPEPLYVGGHWTPELIERAGGRHPINASGSKSIVVEPEALVEMDPDLIILAPCGLNLEATRREAAKLAQRPWWRSLRAVQTGRVVLVDGDAHFNRPGPRLVDALEWLCAVIHGEPGPHDFPSLWLPPLAVDDATPVELTEKQRSVADIEEAHRCAVERGQIQYTDPVTGYAVFTQLASARRGHCCGSGCRHCVYGHVNVKPPERRAALQPPILV